MTNLKPMSEAPTNGNWILLFGKLGNHVRCEVCRYNHYWETQREEDFSQDGACPPVGWLPIPTKIIEPTPEPTSYKLITNGGHVFTGDTITKVAEAWNRRKHSLSDNYADVQIKSIEPMYGK